ncbi:DUF547 domain-containing protein [Roseivirga sp.]|uniref:DUF547 domain-containing protein n=1 Tax=Roseivirga sp. TaxID=1964215 RepID=UPI003B8E0F58
MSLDHERFSRMSKEVLNNYLDGQESDLSRLEDFLTSLKIFQFSELSNDSKKLAFWINIYNGFTNYQIVKNGLQTSVFDKPDFFTNRALVVDEFTLSLDDIEHGILRRNGQRKNSKPLQFLARDTRHKLMLKKLDFRIHFALNCGSISCPLTAYYSAENIDNLLVMATENFVKSEFYIDHAKKTINCSPIFVWYRNDFGNLYLNDPKLSCYQIAERPYKWKLR